MSIDILDKDKNDHEIPLTSSEMSSLWTAYQNDTMAICVLKYFLQHVQDKKIKNVLDYALDLATNHVQTITGIFSKDTFPIPDGFSDHDVDLKAPRLFTDSFFLNYIHHMAKFGMNAYTVALANAARKDIRKYFTECGESSAHLFNKSADVLLSKGIFIRPPYLSTPQQVEYVQKQGFLTGWMGHRRPLTSIEIMELYFNLQRNELGKSLLTGFSQVARSKEVKGFIARAKSIAEKHIEIFSSLLRESDLTIPMTWDASVTDSTVPPFSDKLMMFHERVLSSAGIGYYGAAMSTSPRRDISTQYSRVMAEVVQCSEDGANIMINNAWLEKPPMATDRDYLFQME